MRAASTAATRSCKISVGTVTFQYGGLDATLCLLLDTKHGSYSTKHETISIIYHTIKLVPVCYFIVFISQQAYLSAGAKIFFNVFLQVVGP